MQLERADDAGRGIRPAPPTGGTLKILRGVVPIEVTARRGDIATVADLSRPEGKTVAGEGGVHLTVNRIQTSGPTTTFFVGLESGPTWAADAATQNFEVIDGQGQHPVYLTGENGPFHG